MEHEVQGWRRWIPVLLGLGLVSLIMWMAQDALHSPRGATGPTILLAERPIVAIGVMIVCLGLSFGVAVAVGRMINAVTGMFVLGWGLAILTMRCHTMRELAFTPDLSMSMVVVESLIWSAVVLAAAVFMFRIVGMPNDLVPDIDKPDSHTLWSIDSLRGAAAGLLMIPAMWLIARSELQGQTLAAAMIGAMAAGLLGRMIAPHGSPITLFVAPVLCGAIGQMIGLMVTPKPLDDAFVNGSMSPLLLISPLDLAAGSLTGMAIGIGWAKSFLQHQPVTA